MTIIRLATVVAEDGERYKVKGWRYGSRRTHPPKRPAQLYHLTTEKGWQHLDSWNGAIDKGKGYYRPKEDKTVLKEALTRISTVHGKEVNKIIYHTSNNTNTQGTPLGYGHKSEPLPNYNHEKIAQ